MPKSKPVTKAARAHMTSRAEGPSRAGMARKRGAAGRTRINLMVDRALLERAAAGAGTTNLSDVVDVALRRMAEDDAIVAGLNALYGALPDFPDVDT